MPGQLNETVSMREYLETRIVELEARCNLRFDAQIEHTDAIFASSQQAIAKSEFSTDKRFEAVNEFRGQLSDMVNHLMPRSESTTRYQALSDKVDGMQARLDKSDGSGAGLRNGWTILVGGVALIATLIAIFTAFAKPAPDPNAARLNDVIERLNSLSTRINSIPVPVPK